MLNRIITVIKNTGFSKGFHKVGSIGASNQT